ncbi:sugar ABC transporter permease [Microbacterium sp. ARD32]|uniref:carbohydrate ABC transporter permease n=1 Tax=Microbacterium sp. ARD32 TaxID=2962577 RepID=UPI002881CF3E|nr:sugar ABC transporter permease [Microbacterium sp. ARD32]MDT0158801.1 sugar ABC transporter permease [Microbacterium sp. ARD32]
MKTTQQRAAASAPGEIRAPKRGRYAPSSRRNSLQAGRNLFGYALLAPQTLGMLVVGIVAIGGVVQLSLTRVNVLAGTSDFVGIDNYTRIFGDPAMGVVLSNTFFFVVVLSVGGTVLALALALLLNQKLAGINFFRAAIFVPALVTTVAWTLVWGFILQPGGLLDGIVGLVGAGPLPWLRGEWLTLAVFAVIQLTKNVGINMMIFLAALQAVPQELLDAAHVDGAGRWTRFRHVVLPQISSAIIMVFMLMVSGSFKVFELVLLLTNGGPGVQTSVLAFEIYRQAFRLNDIGYASALSVFLFVLVIALIGIIWQFRKRMVFHESE